MSDKNDDNALNSTDNFEVVTEETISTMNAGDPEKNDSTDESANQGSKESKKADDSKAADGKADAKQENGGEDNDKAEQSSGKRSRRLDKRIARLTKRSKENGERAEKAEQELAEAKAELAKLKNEASRPKRDDFDSSDEFEKKLESWSREQGQQSGKSDKGGKKAPVDEDFEEALADVMGAFEDNASRFDDFDKVVKSEDLKITDTMVMALADTDDPAAIAYHLGNHKDEAEKIAGLSPAKQMKAILKIELKLEADSTGKEESKDEDKTNSKEAPNKQSKAPEPINPLKGGDGTQKKVDDMSFGEYEEHQQKKVKGQGKFW